MTTTTNFSKNPPNNWMVECFEDGTEMKKLLSKRQELQLQLNKINAQLECESRKIIEKNAPLLVAEVMNLIDGIGKGYIFADYYADERYYSDIPGVKNIRFNNDETKVCVKLYSYQGKFLPDSIFVRGKRYKVETFYSSKV